MAAAGLLWDHALVNGAHVVVMGEGGRIVVPAGVRRRERLRAGTTLVLLPTPTGMVLMTREQLRARVADDLAGLDLVGELLEERRNSVEPPVPCAK